MSETSDAFIIHSLPIIQVLLGIVFLGAFAAITIGMGQSVNISCSHMDGEGVTCTLSFKILGMWQTNEVTIQNVEKALVEESQDEYGRPEGLYRIVVATPGDNVPLTKAYTAGRSKKISFVDRFNSLLEDKRAQKFTLDQCIPWWFYAIAGPFGFIGLVITFSARIITVVADRNRSLLVATGRGLFGRSTDTYPFSEIQEFRVKRQSVGRGTYLYAVAVQLESRKGRTLSHYTFGEKRHEKIVEELNIFVKGEAGSRNEYSEIVYLNV